jgi:hypothetical protein
MTKRSVAYIVALLITAGILIIGFACPVIWHSGIVLTVLKTVTVAILAVMRILILIFFLYRVLFDWDRD